MARASDYPNKRTGRVGAANGTTTLKDLNKELGIGLLKSMCADLGLTIKDLNNV